MKGKNFKQNNEYFESLAISLSGGKNEARKRVRGVLPAQLRVGQLVKFTYRNTGRDYTVIVASTPRAPYGIYTTANTKNLLVTTFKIDTYTMEEQVKFLEEVYKSEMQEKMKEVRYIPQEHLTYFNRIKRFWTNLINKIIGRANTKLDSRNFRTFIVFGMTNCKVLK